MKKLVILTMVVSAFCFCDGTKKQLRKLKVKQVQKMSPKKLERPNLKTKKAPKK